ncbi:MAG: vitamin K epoxide reductase family protein [Solirubrobacteraceae bacterium]|jgi:uncharacterized membrane protein
MSDRTLRIPMIVLAAIGVAITTYLTIVHYDHLIVLCTTKVNSCEQVQTSIYSHVLGIPVAVLGLIGYVAILAALLAPNRDYLRLAALAIALFGVIFSGYLTYREIFTLKEICEWCVTSASIMVVLLIGAAVRYVRGFSSSGGAAAASS